MISKSPPSREITDAEDEPTADGGPGPTPGAGPAADGAGDARGGVRRVAARLTPSLVTALACVLVFLALVTPNQIDRLTPAVVVRIPVEALLAVAVLLVLPARPRRVVATVAGVALGLLTVLKILDLGFFKVLGRPFDPVLDWPLLRNALDFLRSSIGEVDATIAAATAVVLAAVIVPLVALSVLRLTRLVARRRTAATRVVTVLATTWVICALLGAQLVPGVSVASGSAAALAYDHVLQARTSVQDQQAFAPDAVADAFRDTPGDELLTALRGKDVIVTYVESYGRDAVEAPEYASQVGAVLDDGTRQLVAAGFASRSAFLTSSTFGGISWLAHSTLQSGLWINNQQRYDKLLASNRTTLSSAFRRAGWQTVGVMPGVETAWPEGGFYGYNRLYDAPSLGYRGPTFGFGIMPDQYTLSAFQRLERAAPGHAPVMAEIPLVSSHVPWAHIPALVDWNAVGDGSVLAPMVNDGKETNLVRSNTVETRTDYRRSIEYSLSSLISFVETYGNDNLVLVFLGDHQAPVITDPSASRDVPVTIVAHDRAVVDRIADWGWQEGLKPGPQAPVWRMDAFRDRFLTAFGP